MKLLFPLSSSISLQYPEPSLQRALKKLLWSYFTRYINLSSELSLSTMINWDTHYFYWQLTLQLLNNHIPGEVRIVIIVNYFTTQCGTAMGQSYSVSRSCLSSPSSHMYVRAHLIHWKLRDAKHSARASWIWESWMQSQVLHSSLSST